MSQQLRIISGRFRGHKLQLPKVTGVRPTPDRMRETLFNWLINDIVSANCLDLFAGSGALGFEALSRGAAGVVFVEHSREMWRYLQASAERLGCANEGRYHCRDVLVWLQRAHGQPPFDIIFADPPFYKGLAEKTAAAIIDGQLLTPNGYLYLEAERRCPLEENLAAQWRVVRKTRAGETVGRLFVQLGVGETSPDALLLYG